MSLLHVENLRVRFEMHHGNVNAVDGVDFSLDEGETLGLVGESGSGKSVTNLALMGLIPSPPGIIDADRVEFDGRNLLTLSAEGMRRIRGNDISMIFQDPMTSLNPLLTIGRQLSEVLEVHLGMGTRKALTLCAAGLADVGISNPERRLRQYPHELSGGMRQRVMIAMALLCEPKILIADEPTTALDVTIQAQILELMKDLQERHGMAIMLITHDLGVVAGMADSVNVMYAGRLVETSPTRALYGHPMHPYTKGLLASVPTLDGDPEATLFSIQGQPPDLAALPRGCAFAPRCSYVVDRCSREEPPLDPLPTTTRRHSACFERARLLDSGAIRLVALEDDLPASVVEAPLEVRTSGELDDDEPLVGISEVVLGTSSARSGLDGDDDDALEFTVTEAGLDEDVDAGSGKSDGESTDDSDSDGGLASLRVEDVGIDLVLDDDDDDYDGPVLGDYGVSGVSLDSSWTEDHSSDGLASEGPETDRLDGESDPDDDDEPARGDQ